MVSSWWVGSGLGVDVKQALTKYSFGSERKYKQSMEYGAPSLIQHSIYEFIVTTFGTGRSTAPGLPPFQ